MNQPLLIFLHIPKTAGRTISSVIANNYPVGSIFVIDSDKGYDHSMQRYHALSATQKGKLRLLRGHIHFGIHEQLDQDYKYFTILRDPMERIISHYYYIRRQPKHYLHNVVVKLSLEEYINNRITEETNNGQTRLLSGLEKVGYPRYAYGKCPEDMLDLAKKNLAKMTVIGLTEQFDETLVLLQNKFGWSNLLYKPVNVTESRPRITDFSNEVIDLIKSDNELDIMLYDHAKNLFQTQIEQIDNFQKKVDQLCSYNNRYGYAYSLWRSLILKTTVVGKTF